MGVEEQQQVVADDCLPLLIDIARVTQIQDSKAFDEACIPSLVGHGMAAWIKPGQIFDVTAPNGTSLKEVAFAKDRLLFANLEDALRKGD